MPEDNEYEEALDFFVNFEGVSKRALDLIPKNTLLAIKKRLDDEYVSKNKMNEVLKGFIKKETVDEKYMKISDVEKNYTPNDQVPESQPTLDEPEVFVCEKCGGSNFDFMYDNHGTKYLLIHCIYCGAELHPPPPPEIIKKYIPRPKEVQRPKTTKYKVRNR